MAVDHEPLRVGVIGVGSISDMYLRCITRTPILRLTSVAASSAARAENKANELEVRAMSVDRMLSDPDIDLVVNLTPAVRHEDLNEAVLRAGKHLYSEKPFALAPRKMAQLQQIAADAGARWSSAPDTYLGGGHQGARRALDAWSIGAPVFGMAFVGHGGVEAFHPNPSQFYRRGGEMPLDIGPYHIAQWISLLGPVRKVYCASRRGKAERVVQRGPAAGQAFPVDVDTSFCIVMDFETATVNLTLSLDVADPTQRPSQLFGTDGVMTLSDPNFFGGAPLIGKFGSPPQAVEVSDLPFSEPNMRNYRGDRVANYRGAGLIDLALSIMQGGRPHTTPAFVAHMVEVMDAILTSAQRGEAVDIESSCDRPAVMGELATDDALVALTPSPQLAEAA